MSRYQFDDVSDRADWTSRSTNIAQFIVRTFGFILMIVGLWIGLKVINESWGLYKQPQNIERIAVAIEQGSNLDKSLSSVRSENVASADNTARNVAEVNSALGFRLSYFAAWIVAILLLMLVGRLSIAAVKTGGELALYDVQIKKFARQLIEQSTQGTKQ